MTDPKPSKVAWEFAELSTGPRILNRWLAAGLVSSIVVNIALTGGIVRVTGEAAAQRPMVVRISDVGRAEAVTYDAATTWAPTEAELTNVTRFLLMQFVEKHYGRLRATIARDYAESLLFLRDDLTDALLQPGTKSPAEVFAADPAAPELDVEVTNVTFPNLTTPPYQAAVDFLQRTYVNGGRGERTTERWTAQIVFTLPNPVPHAVVPVNPLGLRILQLRRDQAFTE